MPDGVVGRFVKGYINIHRAGFAQKGQVTGHNAGVFAGGFEIGDLKGDVRELSTVEKILVAQVAIPFIVIGEDAFAFERQCAGGELLSLLVVAELSFHIPEHAHYRGIADVVHLKRHREMLIVDNVGFRLGHGNGGGQCQ